jgi:FkbM family methyltransferase
MTLPPEHRRRFRRLERLKELMIARTLRFNKLDFGSVRPLVSIVGDHISDRIRVEGIYERELLELLRDCILSRADCRQKVAIDVGANIGNHTLFFSDLFAQVVAIEPNPLTRRMLQLNLEMNGVENVEVQTVALSDHVGRASLAFNKRNLGAASTNGGDPELNETTEVELATGDDVVSSFEPIALIKIDVEGGEEAVLKGLEKTIKSNRPILMIEQLEDAIDEESGSSPSFAFLTGLGYTAIDIGLPRSKKTRLREIVSLLLGRTTYDLRPVKRLEKRNYSALVFLPVHNSAPLAHG